MSLKQKLSSKSLSEKYKIAQLFKNGVKWAKIVKDLDIPSSTVHNVCKNIDHVIGEYKHSGNGEVMHSKPHSFDRVDRPLLELYVHVQITNYVYCTLNTLSGKCKFAHPRNLYTLEIFSGPFQFQHRQILLYY